MIAYVIIALCIITIIIGIANQGKPVKPVKETFIINDDFESVFDINTIHLGGHPNIEIDDRVVFQVKENGVFCMRLPIGNRKGFKHNIIDPSTIIKCECKTEQEIKQSVTFTRLLALGIYSLAFKKQNKITNFYMVFDYKLNGIPISCIFQASDGQKLSKLVYKINEAMVSSNIKAMTN